MSRYSNRRKRQKITNQNRLKTIKHGGVNALELQRLQDQEIKEYRSQCRFNWLVKSTKKNIYHSPANIPFKSKFEHIPKPIPKEARKY